MLLAISMAGAEELDQDNRMTVVSIVQVLVQATDFADRRVRVTGYLVYTGAGLNLFLTKDHSDVFDLASSLRVLDDTKDASLSQSRCLDRYVSVEGRIRKFEGIAWVIADVERVRDLEQRRTCWDRSKQ
jgi:hypothetical protein